MLSPILAEYFILFSSTWFKYFLQVYNLFLADTHEQCQVYGSFPCLAGFHTLYQHLSWEVCLVSLSALCWRRQLTVPVWEHYTVFLYSLHSSSWLDHCSCTVDSEVSPGASLGLVLCRIIVAPFSTCTSVPTLCSVYQDQEPILSGF